MVSRNRLTFLLQIILVPAIVYICKNAYDEYSRPMVLTKNGWVRGLTSEDGDHDMFLGIPYAKVREDNPFGAADPYPKYDDVFEAVDDTKNCPQRDEISEIVGGSLDCLRVNIYVPKPRQEKMPVMAYILGGKFLFGFSGTFRDGRMYGPEYLVRYGVIYVVFNHRAGAYGYMCLGTPEVPGNAGLKDQVLALRWIKENIEAFGGDPDKITAFGHSSGAISLDFHVNYLQEDLFHQVIIQSGSILVPTSLEPVDRSVPIRIADKLGFKTDDFQEAIEFLTKQSTSAIVAADFKLGIQHRPCVEEEFGPDNYITKYPKDIIPNVKNRKILMGHTRDEAGMMLSPLPAKYFESLAVFKDSIAPIFDFDTSEELEEVCEYVKQYYIGDDVMSGKFKEHAINASSDIVFSYPMHRQMARYMEYGAEKIFFYVFSYVGARNLYKSFMKASVGGAMHADEIGYLYEPYFFKKHKAPEDMLMVDRMTMLWTNFAKYGDPTFTTSEILPTKWLPISNDNRAYFLIDKHMRMDTEMLERMEFWRELYDTYWENIKEYLLT
ncbi:acetylcholinesterase-like [Colias croceus]|uniref:acetylcholinesterase-like n=1 Tax=Colias crocea TaxID=72248 RepID=UPI001E279FF7|nr:acetylcholinesterase-like [Colias croceus]